MHRYFGLALGLAFLGVGITGCGEDQPNAPAQESELTPDFAKKTADQMKAANTGMDLKNAPKPGR
jgi:hypothetical protein